MCVFTQKLERFCCLGCFLKVKQHQFCSDFEYFLILMWFEYQRKKFASHWTVIFSILTQFCGQALWSGNGVFSSELDLLLGLEMVRLLCCFIGMLA